MFRRGKTKGPVANKLSRQAEPNKLTWAAADAETRDLEPAEDEFLDDAFDDDEVEEVDERTLAQRQADLQAELDRQAEEFGLTSANPQAVYGPKGEDVAALLDLLHEIEPDEMERLAEAWEAVDPADRDIVQREIRRRHRTERHEYELSAAEDAVTAWLNARPTSGEDEAALLRIVAAAARDAVDALILDEELDDADFVTLYGPWADVMDSDEGGGEAADEAEDEAAAGGSAGASGDATEESDEEFGPNTELVRQFLAKLGELTPDQLAELTASWNGQSREDLRQAHRAMQELAKEDESWRQQVKAAQGQITTWANGPHTARVIRQDRLFSTEVEARLAALPPATDAVSALVLADLLEPEDAEVLYTAWEGTVGEPKLPEFADDGNA
jgi:hypothetical protein